MSNSITVDQHYVPQFYLKNFSTKRKRKRKPAFNLFMFDKSLSVSENRNIESVACEKYFYDEPCEEGDKQIIEEMFKSIENDFALEIENILSELNAEGEIVVSDSLKREISTYIVLQAVRTKELREQLKQVALSNAELLSEIYLKSIYPDDPNVMNSVDSKVNEQLLHKKGLTNYNLILNLSNKISDYILIIVKNKTDINFYTSDHPVVKNSHSLGFLSKGVELYFPISPKYLFSILERSSHEELSQLDKRSVSISDQAFIEYTNTLQVSQSYQYLFSLNDDFSLAKSLIAENPEFSESGRRRVQTTFNKDTNQLHSKLI